MTVIDLQEIRTTVDLLAEQLGINLDVYGNASPTKLIIEVLIASTQVIQEAALVCQTEQNPVTSLQFKSKLGNAAMVGLNPASLLIGSVGKVTVDNNGADVLIKQHAKLKSNVGIPYYIVLPSDVIRISEPTELLVKQGELHEITVTSTGETWEAFDLPSANYIAADSLEVYVDGIRLSVGYQIDENPDCFFMLNYDGKPMLLMNKTVSIESGKTIYIQYADCVGYSGDNAKAGEHMVADNFATIGEEDAGDSITVYISEPIIGGTDFDKLSTELTHAIVLNGKNNLVGNEAQLMSYLKRFKQYTIQSSNISAGVLYLTAARNLEILSQSMTYWAATYELDLTEQDVSALLTHINELSIKTTDLLVNILPTTIEHCKVFIQASMAKPDISKVILVVEEYLISASNKRRYDTASLYEALKSKVDITEFVCRFEGNINEFGSAEPTSSSAILVCSAAMIQLNGVTYNYGWYNGPPEGTGNNEGTVTIERILAINSIVNNLPIAPTN